MTSHFPFPSKAANNCLRAGNRASAKRTKRANLPPLEIISLTTGTSTFPYECTRKGWLMHFTYIISNGSNSFKFHRIQAIWVVNVSVALDVLINELNAVQFPLSGMKLVCWNHPDSMHDTHSTVTPSASCTWYLPLCSRQFQCRRTVTISAVGDSLFNCWTLRSHQWSLAWTLLRHLLYHPH